MGSFRCYDSSNVIATLMMANFHLNTTDVAIFPNVCLWRRSLCSDLVLTLKNCIEPPSYARTAYMFLACVASVSNQVTERKLEREQPPPPPSFLFFCFRPNFLDEHARKRLLRRLICCFNMALISFRLFRKNLGNLPDFFGQMVYRPPWQKNSRTPMLVNQSYIVKYPESVP